VKLSCRQAMARALRLAARPQGATHPNPMVGAVVLSSHGELAGEAYHRRPGEPHAEVLALRAASGMARGGTLCVTLEPCNHHGRTPPCTEAILAAGVARVVVGMRDPNPAVAGGGTERLRRAGVEVEVGLLEEQCRQLNEDWIVRVTLGRPYVALKAAVTLDGWLATSRGDARWISGEQSRGQVMRLRSRADAVLVGTRTLLADDPRLTARLRGARQPWRVALDPQLRCPVGAAILQPGGGPTLLFAASGAAPERERALRQAGAEIVHLPCTARGRLDLPAALAELARREVVSLLVEGGGELHRELLELELVDRAYLFVAPRIFGGVDGVPLAGRQPGARRVAEGWVLSGVRWRCFGEDALVSGVPVRRGGGGEGGVPDPGRSPQEGKRVDSDGGQIGDPGVAAEQSPRSGQGGRYS